MSKTFKLPKLFVRVTNSQGHVVSSRSVGPFVFKKKKHADAIDEWNIKIKNGSKIGSIYVRHDDKNCVTNTWLQDKFHGMGLGKRMYQILVDYYGYLESDPSGSTSDDASRVWKSLGAKKGAGRSKFRLESKVNNNWKYEEVSKWKNFISSMKNWWKQVKLIPKKSLVKIG